VTTQAAEIHSHCSAWIKRRPNLRFKLSWLQ
jgi:hypothetical protein